MEKQDMVIDIFKVDTGIAGDVMKDVMKDNIEAYVKTNTRGKMKVKEVNVVSKKDAVEELKQLGSNSNKENISKIFKNILSSSWSIDYVNDALKEVKNCCPRGKEYLELINDFYLKDSKPNTELIRKNMGLSRATVYKYKDEGLTILGYYIMNLIIHSDQNDNAETIE